MRVYNTLIAATILACTQGALVAVETDVPIGPGALWGAPRLFERLRVEVKNVDGPCNDCIREFALDGSTFRNGSETLRVEQEGATITATLLRRQASFPLFTQSGTERVALSFGTLFGTSNVVTQAKRGRVTCQIAAREGEACVPGGLAWTGDQTLDLAAAIEVRGREERIVAISPFMLQEREVTVGEFRARRPTVGVITTHEQDAACNFSNAASERDEYAMNCVTGDAAEAYCRALGMELPTEWQFEYVTGRGLGERFPWGSGEPGCADAIHGGAACGRSAPGPAGRGTRDRIAMPDGSEIVDLAGNVAEWTYDSFLEFDKDPCITGPVQVDPTCRKPEPIGSEMRVVRGGDFNTGRSYMASALRRFTPVRSISHSIGFRCARTP
jgi:formylglycine-generating enzyme required for sulfatase activity